MEDHADNYEPCNAHQYAIVVSSFLSPDHIPLHSCTVDLVNKGTKNYILPVSPCKLR